MAGPYVQVTRATKLPGHCIRCPRNMNLIDFGVDIPGFGTIYLCEPCFGELADEAGLVSGERLTRTVAALEDTIADQRETVIALTHDRDAALLAATLTPTDDALKELEDGISAARDRFRDRVRTDAGRTDPGAAALDPADPGIDDAAGDADADVPDEPARVEPAAVVGGARADDPFALIVGGGPDGAADAPVDAAVE